MSLRLSLLTGFTVCVFALSCTGLSEPIQTEAPTLSQVLSSRAELVEFIAPTTRRALLNESLLTAQVQNNAGLSGQVLFAIETNGVFTAAPNLSISLELFNSRQPASSVNTEFAPQGPNRFSESRRQSLMGLSEREVAELLARLLAAQWSLDAHATLRIERASQMPYAAVLSGNTLRLNPAFLYLAASQAE